MPRAEYEDLGQLAQDGQWLQRHLILRRAHPRHARRVLYLLHLGLVHFIPGFGLRDQCLGFRVPGSGFQVPGFGFGISGARFRKISGFDIFRIPVGKLQGSRFRGLNFGFPVAGFVCRVSG